VWVGTSDLVFVTIPGTGQGKVTILQYDRGNCKDQSAHLRRNWSGYKKSFWAASIKASSTTGMERYMLAATGSQPVTKL
jgi:hypothetical protein